MMFELLTGHPGDRRNLFHKKLLAGVIGFATGGPGGALKGVITGGKKPKPAANVKFDLFATRAGPSPAEFSRAHRDLTGCIRGAVFDRTLNLCVPRSIVGNGQHVPLPDIDPGFLSPGEASISVGQAVMGRYGAGMSPGNQVINRADCSMNGQVRGMVLGNDGVCYNRRDISNKERMWPRGRRPLLTGGDMRAISTAARAAGRLERTTKRLQKIGLMKKPAPRRLTKPSVQVAHPSGHVLADHIHVR